jgi:hypothetical protein
MALVDITPIMTSNTTPAPYVVSASSEYGSTLRAYNAFNPNGEWVSAASTPTGWLKIDFGSATKTDALSINGRGGELNTNVKNFIIYGSSDDLIYEQIKSVDNQILWTSNETRLFTFDKTVTYRYYKIVISSNNGGAVVGIVRIMFWQDDGAFVHVTNIKSSGLNTLPHNSTLAMKQRQNDGREFLLGVADDTSNYGTLWMINSSGQAEIPKAAMAKSDILFDGTANTVGTNYSMISSYKNYSYLLVAGGIGNGTEEQNNILINTNLIISKNNQFGIGYYNSTTYFWGICFGFTSETVLVIAAIPTVGWTASCIQKIYGIK